MSFKGVVVSVADLDAVARLPAAWRTLLMVKPEGGSLAKGDTIRVAGGAHEVLGVADNTAFFDEVVDGAVGVALGAPLGKESVGEDVTANG